MDYTKHNKMDFMMQNPTECHWHTPSFIENLIQAAANTQDPHIRLAMLTSLWSDIRALENQYGLKARELNALRNEIGIAFTQVSNPDIALVAALSIDLFDQADFDFRKSRSYENLGPTHQLDRIKQQVRSRIDQLQQQITQEIR